MIRFAWSAEDVEEKIRKLVKNRHKKLAKKAFKHLTKEYDNDQQLHRLCQQAQGVLGRPILQPRNRNGSGL